MACLTSKVSGLRHDFERLVKALEKPDGLTIGESGEVHSDTENWEPRLRAHDIGEVRDALSSFHEAKRELDQAEEDWSEFDR